MLPNSSHGGFGKTVGIIIYLEMRFWFAVEIRSRVEIKASHGKLSLSLSDNFKTLLLLLMMLLLKLMMIKRNELAPDFWRVESSSFLIFRFLPFFAEKGAKRHKRASCKKKFFGPTIIFRLYYESCVRRTAGPVWPKVGIKIAQCFQKYPEQFFLKSSVFKLFQKSPNILLLL